MSACRSSWAPMLGDGTSDDPGDGGISAPSSACPRLSKAGSVRPATGLFSCAGWAAGGMPPPVMVMRGSLPLEAPSSSGRP